MRKMGMQVSEEKMLLMVSRMNAEALRINAEEVEDASSQVWVKRRFPGRRAGGRAEGIAEAAAGGDGGADASHLPTEAEVIFCALEFVGVADDDPAHAEKQGDSDHPELRSADAGPCIEKLGRDAFAGGGHRGA